MKVTIREESPDGTVVESSVTFEKDKESNTEEDEPASVPVMPGPIVVCGLRGLACLLFGGMCLGRKRSS